MIEDVLSRWLAASGVDLARLSVTTMGNSLVALAVAGSAGLAAQAYLPAHPATAGYSVSRVPVSRAAPPSATPEADIPVVVLTTPQQAPTPQPPPAGISPTAKSTTLMRGPQPAVRPQPTAALPQAKTTPPPRPLPTVTDAAAPARIAALAPPAPDVAPQAAPAPAAKRAAAPPSRPPPHERTASAPRRTPKPQTLSANQAAKLLFRDIKRAFASF